MSSDDDTRITENDILEARAVAYALLRAKGYSHEITEEALGDAVKQAHVHRGTLEKRRALRSWFFTIARNAAENLRARKGYGDSVGEYAAEDRASAEPTPEEIMRKRESARIVRLALLQLAPRQRECVTMRFLQDMKNAEIAEVLEITEQAVRQNVHQGLKRLHTLLEPQRVNITVP